MAGEVHVVLPAGVDDPARPSGGNVYDRRLLDGLRATGWTVHELPAAGTWPHPDGAALAALAASLRTVPDGAVVLVDGLVGSAAAQVLVPVADRLRLVALVHLAIGDDAEGEVLRGCAAVIGTSRWTSRFLADRHDLPRAALHVAEPGVVPTAPAAGGAGGALLAVGAVTPTKGQDVLVSALEQVLELPWRLTVAGSVEVEPAFAARVRDAARGAGMGTRVTVLGARPEREVDALYAAADLVVVASRFESYGMVVTEALARGLPVVATDVGGVREALGRTADGELPGLLVPAGDDSALAAALRTWLTDRRLRERLRGAARERRLGLRPWSATVQDVAQVLERVARG